MNDRHDHSEQTQWSGDDTRELGPDYELDYCSSCGAAPDELCTPFCECPSCLRHRPTSVPDEAA